MVSGSLRQLLTADGVGNFELLEMECRVGAEAELPAEFLFQFDKDRFILGSQTIQHFGMNEDAELWLLVAALFAKFAQEFRDLALDFDGHRQRALDHAFAFAVRAILVDGAGHDFAMTLAGHFHEAELRDIQDAGLGLVPTDAFPHFLRDALLVVALTHVDEIDDDQAADIAEAKLAADFLGGFEVRLQDRCIKVLLRFVTAGIDVDSDERFGFVNADVPARFQPDLATECILDLFLDTELAEDGRGLVVEPDLAP